MSAIMRSVSVVAVLALSALAGAASATSGASPAKFKPLQGVSLHLGSKHAVGYFHADNGVCQLTLVVGEELKGDVSPAVASARFRTAIEGAGMRALTSERERNCGSAVRWALPR